jgi:hypothetical protein
MATTAKNPDTEPNRENDCSDSKNMFTRGSFYLLLATAIFTGWYAFTASDTETRQLRAYIIVNNARFSRNPAGGLKYGLIAANGAKELLIYYDVINEGNTPAYDVLRVIGIREPFFSKKLELNYTDGTAAYISKTQTFGPIRTAGFLPDQIDKIISGKAPLIFAGKITYRDIFDNTWPTNFCFIYVARPVEPSFDYCPRWSKNDRLNYAR